MSQFNRIASFVVASQLDPNSNIDTQTAAEIVAASTDGNTLIYSNSPLGTVGFVDITDPSAPVGLGEVDMGGEPTSVAVLGNYALVAVNTSFGPAPDFNPDFVNPSGQLRAVDITTRQIIQSWDIGGQPDSISISADGNYAVIAIENERDEDLNDGALPQLPAGNVVIVNTSDADPANWTTTIVDLTGLGGLTEATDPEPEFVDISSENVAAVTLQENNAIVLINLATASVIASFTAGTVDLTGVDTVEEDPAVIDQTGTLDDVLREPDGITFIGTNYIATANEGDLDGGSRGFTIFDLEGNVVYDSGSELDQIAAQVGHYPDGRSENKGNEPENIEFSTFDGTDYLFVNSERSNLVFVYNVEDPTNPVFEQVLPAGVGPEGGKAIPDRNLLVVASEEDSRDDLIRSVVNIYEYSDDLALYPTLQSVDGANGVPIPWSAMSGLAAGPGDTLYAVEDSFYGSNRFFTIDTSTTPASLTTATTLKDTNDVFAALRPDLVNGDTDKTVNIDPEGIAATGDGFLWIASEGAGAAADADKILNYLFKVDATTGTIAEVITLPDEVNAKQIRFGLEGVAYDNGKLVVVLQRAWTGDPNPRVLVYDTATAAWVGDYFYPLDAVESQNGGWVGLSDISPLGNNNFLVLERDNQGGPDAAIKRLYSINLSDLSSGDTIEKYFVRDLIPDFTAAGGLMPEKLEGLAVTENQIWVINDNDGVDDNSGETQLVSLDFSLNELPFDTDQPAQMQGLNGYVVDPLFTVGESFINAEGEIYTPPGILDGLGAFALDEDTVRVYANHELSSDVGYAYQLANGTFLEGARVSYFDINKDTRTLEATGLAYDTIYNRAGEVVDSPDDLVFGGFDRFCSAQYIEAEQFGAGRGLVDDIFFTGEETDGGTEFALDPDTNTLYAVPWMGLAAWESVTELDTGTTDKVALLVGDDRGGAPLLLYVGDKGQGDGPEFLVRNGLASGKLYVWVANSGETTPEEFKGTGQNRDGSFVAIDYYRPDLAGNGEYDELGFATQEKQDALAEAAGAFQFSRPEDLATNPVDGTQAVLASTGRDSLFPSDKWGTTYIIDADFSDLNNITANLNTIYNGDDAGDGQFEGPDYGLRSPDNLDWADDGQIYLQEDRSYNEFGLTSGEEASIWRLDPTTGALTRVAQIDRNAVPDGQSDRSPDDIGNWESSGIIDVSTLFGEDPGNLFLFDVQAHSIRDGVIADAELVQGGQLAFLEAPDVNEAPVFGEESYEFTIANDAEEGDDVGEPLTATDPDEGDTITYSITAGNDDRDGDGVLAFDINDQGQITVVDAEDLATAENIFNLVVTATDSDGLTDTTEVQITVDSGTIAEDPNTPGIFVIASNELINLLVQATTEINNFTLGIFFTDDASGTINGSNPGDSDYAAKAQERSLSLLSVLGGDKNDKIPPGQLKKVLGLQSAASLVSAQQSTDLFFGFIGSSLSSEGSESISLSTDDDFEITPNEDGSFSISLGNNTFTFESTYTLDNVSEYVPDLPLLVGDDDEQVSAVIADFSDVEPNTPISFTATVSREAAYDNVLGFFAVNVNGDVITLTGDTVAFGDNDTYRQAIRDNLRKNDLEVDDGEDQSFSINVTVNNVLNGFYILPVLAVQGDFTTAAEIYYPVLSLNDDNLDRMASFGVSQTGALVFGFEDLPSAVSDRDFDDFVVQVTFA
jgi:hypothetical protein